MATPYPQTARALAQDRPVLAHVAWIASGLVLIAWILWFCFSSLTLYQTSRRARLEVRRAPHAVDATAAGALLSTSLVMGRTVKAGEVLVELDATRERLRGEEERARLAALDARIAALRREILARDGARAEDARAARAAADVARARLEETQAALDYARGNEQRMTRLIASGGGARVEGLKATAEVQKLSAAQAAQMAEVERGDREARSRDFQNEAQVEDLRHTLASLEGDREASSRALATLAAEIERHVLRAAIDGRLGDVASARKGTYVAEGQRLATIIPRDDLIIVAEFEPSVALGRVREGQHAAMRLDGYPWAQYGTVPAIVTAVAGEIRDGVLRVELQPSQAVGASIALEHGLSGSVEIALEETTPSTLLLRSAGLAISGARAGTQSP
ncbi:MAG: HlyD family efflux transporter periplasmic adaptor subunit [Alsobacter sp.]